MRARARENGAMQEVPDEVESPDVQPLRRGRLEIVGGIFIVLGFALGAWILTRGDPPFVIDVWWNDLLAAWISPFMTGLSLAMNWIGGGWRGVLALPLIIAIVLVVLRRPWGAIYFIAASAASAGVVQLVKHTFGRARPEDIAVVSDFGSYPSGHVANAATIAVSLMVIFPRLWVIIAGAVWILVMAMSRTYLHAHWLSDTLGGAMIGIGVALLVGGFFANQLAREPRPRRERVEPAAGEGSGASG
jgi:membrane-associated phospholipid phosphatase